MMKSASAKSVKITTTSATASAPRNHHTKAIGGGTLVRVGKLVVNYNGCLTYTDSEASGALTKFTKYVTVPKNDGENEKVIEENTYNNNNQIDNICISFVFRSHSYLNHAIQF